MTVSVIITCYNYGKYLEGCLESVLRQTYDDLEIVVVNDGSADNTDEVIKAFSGFKSVVYVKQPNAGQAHAKNTGIKHASGEYIAFLDADDLWCADKLEKQMPCFDSQDVGVVYCRAKYVDENNAVFDYEMTSPYLQPRRGEVTEWLFFDNFVQFSSTVVRRECFERFGLFNESLKMGIDWDLWLRISTAYKFDFIDNRLFFYRMGHADQMSKNLEERQRCSDRIMENFLMKYPGTLSPWTVKKAHAVTCCSRGEYFRKIDRRKSTGYFVNALKMNPIEMGAYKGLIKNFLYT